MPSPFAHVVNLGCRVNRVESDRMCGDLVRAGFALVDAEQADVVVINTCAVTGEAEAKTRKAVRHALGLPRKPVVIVTGCVVNLHAEALTELSERVVAEPSKVDVAACAARALRMPARGLAGAQISQHDTAALLGRSRLGVKVQDGCNHRCTYCIVWKARGPERSVPVESVLDQVREAHRAGIPEVVLTGVNLGAYDGAGAGDSHVEIDELLDIILKATDIPHVRLSSLEPMDVSLRLVERMAADASRVAPFLHLPLQSGCTSTLRRMGRPYSAERFRDIVGRAREILPALSLSCDVIAGFPGETDEQAAESVAFCEEMGFSRMHVFRYSARPGTPAAAMPDQVPAEVIAARAAELRGVAEESARRDARSRIGTVERAVLEYSNRGTLASFHRVVVDDLPQDSRPSLVDVRIADMDERGLLHARARG